MNQDLASKLIAHYEDVISYVGKLYDMDLIQNLLVDTKTNKGICYCATAHFDEYLYDDEWIRSFPNPNYYYWIKTPDNATTKEEVIHALQFRVDRLKTFSE